MSAFLWSNLISYLEKRSNQSFTFSRDGNSIVEGSGEVSGSGSTTSAEFKNTLNGTNAEFALSRTCGSVGTSAECSSNSESGFCEWELEERREADGGKRY